MPAMGSGTEYPCVARYLCVPAESGMWLAELSMLGRVHTCLVYRIHDVQRYTHISF